jgi:hypothetical protein
VPTGGHCAGGLHCHHGRAAGLLAGTRVVHGFVRTIAKHKVVDAYRAVGAEDPVTSRHLQVLVYEAAEPTLVAAVGWPRWSVGKC